MKEKTEQLKLIKSQKKNELMYYVAFSHMLNIRPIIKTKLLEYFDFDVEKAYNVSQNEFKQVIEYYEISASNNFFKVRDKIDIEKCYLEVLNNEDIGIITPLDKEFPPLLKEIPDYPVCLYFKGNFEGIDFDRNVAVVGSRNASTTAKLSLNSIISNLKNSNITIVSGLAAGIDSQAHISAIENNLKTIAVVGTGLDIVYPSQNKNLFDNITNNFGVALSEYPLKTNPAPQNFPQRNRIVVGMSKGTLVAEAKLKSGAMISANLTLDYNRELMCMPGNILNPNTSGIYHLIRNGAGIVATAEDLLNQLGWDIIIEDNQKFDIVLNDIQKKVIETIELEAKTFDEIVDISKEDVSKIMVTLTELELNGLIKQSNNKYYKCV